MPSAHTHHVAGGSLRPVESRQQGMTSPATCLRASVASHALCVATMTTREADTTTNATNATGDRQTPGERSLFPAEGVGCD
jgi:hypothetical protein